MWYNKQANVYKLRGVLDELRAGRSEVRDPNVP